MYYNVNHVEGMLTIENIHADVFLPICNVCNFPTKSFRVIDGNKLQCSKCEQLTTYRRSPQLQCIIQTMENIQKECIVKDALLMTLCPFLQDITYEKYLENTSDIIYSLRDFHVQGTFTIDHDKVILHKE